MRKIILFSLCLIHSIAFSQETEWGPTSKIKNSFHQKIIGETESGIYLLTSSKSFEHDYYGSGHMGLNQKINLLHFSNDLNFKTESILEFSKKPLIIIDAFVNADHIRIVYIGTDGSLVFDDYSFTGVKSSTKSFEKAWKEKVLSGNWSSRYRYSRSENGESYCFFNMNEMIIINKNLIKVRNVQFEEGQILLNVYALDKNTFYITVKDNEAVLHKLDYNESDDELKLTFPSYDIWNLKLRYSKSEDRLYVTSLYGDKKTKKFFTGSVQTFGRKYALGVNVNLVDKEKMSEIFTFTQKFEDDIMLSVTKKKNIEKVKGIDWLYIKNSFFEDNRFILIIERGITYYTPKSVSKYNFDDIILMSINESSSNQKAIDRSYPDMAQYLYMMSSFSTYKNGKLYLAYHQKHVRYHMNYYYFDSSLNQLSHDEVDTYKQKGIYYGVNKGFNSENNAVLFYGRYQKNVGLARIKLK